MFLYSLTEYFLKQAMQELDSDNLRQEQVLLDKLLPLENRILPIAADALLAGVDPVSSYLERNTNLVYGQRGEMLIFNNRGL